MSRKEDSVEKFRAFVRAHGPEHSLRDDHVETDVDIIVSIFEAGYSAGEQLNEETIGFGLRVFFSSFCKGIETGANHDRDVLQLLVDSCPHLQPESELKTRKDERSIFDIAAEEGLEF